MVDPEKAADEVCAILSGGADQDYIGEAVSQLEHALQAAHLARRVGADDELVLAALCHDIGHLAAPANAPSMAGLGVVLHEQIGAELLRRLGFSERVCVLVASHVQAKRYLATKTPGYLERLSPASRGTLEWQGGPMSAEEADRFAAESRFQDRLRVRMWDEGAKDPEAKVEDLSFYRVKIIQHLQRQ